VLRRRSLNSRPLDFKVGLSVVCVEPLSGSFALPIGAIVDTVSE